MFPSQRLCPAPVRLNPHRGRRDASRLSPCQWRSTLATMAKWSRSILPCSEMMALSQSTRATACQHARRAVATAHVALTLTRQKGAYVPQRPRQQRPVLLLLLPCLWGYTQAVVVVQTTSMRAQSRRHILLNTLNRVRRYSSQTLSTSTSTEPSVNVPLTAITVQSNTRRSSTCIHWSLQATRVQRSRVVLVLLRLAAAVLAQSQRSPQRRHNQATTTKTEQVRA